MRFILNGTPFELTADEVRDRLRHVEPEPVHQLAVRVDGRLYPVKQAFEVATGVPRSEFISHTARRHLASLGFEQTGEIASRDQPHPAVATPPTPVTGATDAGDGSVVEPGLAFAGRYQIIRLLGQGDRKRTYLALDAILDRQVALALIKPEAARLDILGTKREAAMLVQVGSHDNIVTLYDRGTAGALEYLVFEYLPGGTLREYLAAQEEHRLAVDDVMRLGRQLARALSHVHQRGLIHRDVAPANIWLDERKVAHLGDFDSAVSPDAGHSTEALPPTTEAYAPPEQLAGNPLDERADLYSLGAVLYEAATGKRPERREKASWHPGSSSEISRLPLMRSFTGCSASLLRKGLRPPAPCWKCSSLLVRRAALGKTLFPGLRPSRSRWPRFCGITMQKSILRSRESTCLTSSRRWRSSRSRLR
jgi:serine/threonine protein kinase